MPNCCDGRFLALGVIFDSQAIIRAPLSHYGRRQEEEKEMNATEWKNSLAERLSGIPRLIYLISIIGLRN